MPDKAQMEPAAQARAIPYGHPVSDVSAFVKAPKQERSRLSFDKAMDAALALMMERRSDAFTLAEVADLAGVSIGSIYGRVGSKEDLIRAAQAREMDRIRAEQAAAFATEPAPDESLDDVVRRVVTTLAEVLRSNAALLAPFMAIGAHDPVVANLGKAAFEESVAAFCTALEARGDDISHPEPEHALQWSFTVTYSVLARWLGLGSEPEAAGEGDWEAILADLSDMVSAFLTTKDRGARGTS
jgi:AcrR family transcriptional regulator